ncbi:MAG: hypothetical protein KGV50_01675 [Gammaproteobacteria bacterium]|nr:hypothetical protein [Gammaproteobacteria bacterium]
MTDSKPYLIRAIHQWISDNSLTPYLYIDTTQKGISLPQNLYAESPLILNVSLSACQNLVLENNQITFQARFSGRVFDVYLPMSCIMAIIARENGQGLTFDVSPDHTVDVLDLTDEDSEKNNHPPKGGLKVVK